MSLRNCAGVLAAVASQPSAQVYRRLLEVYRRTLDDEKLLRLLGEIVDKSGSLDVVEKEIESLVKEKQRVESLVKLARENAKEKIGAMLSPLVNQMGVTNVIIDFKNKKRTD